MIVSVGFLSALVTKAGAVGDEQIFHVMRLAVLVQRRSFGMLAHANRADFVDDHAAVGDSVGIRAVGQFLGHVDSARRLDDFAVGFLHIFRHLDFVVAPLPVETQHGDAPLVDSGRIDLAVAILIGNHFAATGESNERAVFFLALLLQRRAVAFKLVAQVIVVANAGHAAAAAEFGVVSAEKIVLAIVLPPRQVHVHAAHAVVIVRRHLFERGKYPPPSLPTVSIR